MKNIAIFLFVVVLTACGKSRNDGVSVDSLDLSSLPTTTVAVITMDSSVEEGVDAFASFNSDGQEVTIAVSEPVGAAAGISIDNNFTGKVELTISGEHEVSNQFMKVYTVSSMTKL